MKIQISGFLLILLLALVSCKKDKSTVIINSWVAESVTQENRDVLTPENQIEYILSFESENKYTLKLDVNSCSGELAFKRKSVQFNSGVACTKACCDSKFAMLLIAILPKTDKWKISGNRLSFTNNKGVSVSFIKK